MNARIRALTSQRQRLDAYARGIVGEVTAAMNNQLNETVKQMHFEPPPKEGSRYVRTHNYATKWTTSGIIHQTHEGLVGRIENPMRYAVYVGGDEQGKGRQNDVTPGWHAEGWPRLAEVLRIGYQQRLKHALRN